MARSTVPRKQCKECPEGSKRAALYEGPRCFTHHKARIKSRSDDNHKRHIESTYNISVEQYWELYEAQGGHCYICPNKGTSKRLAVDHAHSCCSGKTSCGRCVRGLLCGPCNKQLGRWKDSTEPALRYIEYLTNPPAKAVLSGPST